MTASTAAYLLTTILIWWLYVSVPLTRAMAYIGASLSLWDDIRADQTAVKGMLLGSIIGLVVMTAVAILLQYVAHSYIYVGQPLG